MVITAVASCRENEAQQFTDKQSLIKSNIDIEFANTSRETTITGTSAAYATGSMPSSLTTGRPAASSLLPLYPLRIGKTSCRPLYVTESPLLTYAISGEHISIAGSDDGV